jgi:hypothetical protein
MFIHRQCSYLCRLSKIIYHSPNQNNKILNAERLLTDKNFWLNNNGCFAPIRFFVKVPKIQDYNIILHLRDPRDVLVSMFYSYCFIHTANIAEASIKHRKETAEKGIDEFVLAKCSSKSLEYTENCGSGRHVEHLIGNIPRRYNDYINNLLGKNNVTFLKYEEMVTDYQSWINKFIKPFNIENHEKVVSELSAQSENFFPSRTIDVMSHIRHVTPGDYKNKLKPSTIERLNNIFSLVLDSLDYEK